METKIVYRFNDATKSIIEIICFEDTRNRGNFIIPPDCIEDAPPEINEHQCVIRENNEWKVIDDYRHIKLYNKETQEEIEIVELNETPDDYPKYTLLKPETIFDIFVDDKWQFSLDLYKENKKNEIKKFFDLSLSTGSFMSNAIGIKVDCRRGITTNDLQNVKGLISYMQRNNVETEVYRGLTDSDNAEVNINQLFALIAEMEDYGVFLYNKKRTIERDIMSCETKEEVDNISWAF